MAQAELLTDLTPARRQLAFYLLLLGPFLPSLNMFVVTIALPVIRGALGASPAESSLIVSGYSSAYAVCLITGGRLGDLFGRRRMFLIGMTGFTAMSLVCGLAPNAEILVTARVLQGMFSALMAPPVLASIRTLFAQQDIPWALNVYGTGVGMAVAAGQFLGGMLLSVNAWGLGWRSAFLVNVPVGLFALATVPFLVPESSGGEKPRLDYGGVLLLSAALACLVVPLSIGRERHWAAPVLVLLAASPLLVVAFLAFERALMRRGGMPVLDAKLLEIGTFRRGLIVALLFFFTAPFYLFFSLYLQAGLSVTPLAAGLAVLPYGIANFIAPMMATRFPATSRPYLFGVGMAVEVLGYAGVALCAEWQIGGWALLFVVFIGGFGQGIAMPVMFDLILGKVPRQHTGLAAGMMNSTLQLGAAISVAAIGSVFFAVLGDGTTAHDYGNALAVAMECQIVALIAATLLGLRNARRAA
jgi:EmrB/QacA subfamily drug resistance transporter